MPLFYTRRVLVFDSLLFASNPPGLNIINFSNPANPEIIYSNDSLFISDFSIHNGLLCAAGYRDTIPSFLIYDIQDPATPKIIGVADIQLYPRSFAIRDTFAYVSNDIYSQVVNIADPSNPFVASTFSLPGICDMEISDNKLFCIGRHEGGSRGLLSVYDLTDPMIPHRIASIPTYGIYYYNKISVMNNMVYCCNSEGLAIYGFDETGLFQETPERWLPFCVVASPNPFSTILHIQLPVSNTKQNIKLQIFDVSGKLVKQYISIPGIKGNHFHLQWDGTDRKNEQVPAGTYFLKVQQGNNSVSKKVIRIR
jgi:hypothetical protein